ELALNTTNLAYDSTNSELVYTNSKGEEVRVDISELVAANTTNTLRLTGNEITSTVNAVESSDTLTDANITSRTEEHSVRNTITYTDAAGNEMELALNTTNLAYDSTNSELVYTNSKGEEVRVDISELVAANTTNTLRLTGNELTSTVNGVESSVTLTDANITSDKGITSNTINLTGETGATLKDVTMEIKPGGANQVLITDATGDGVTWV